MKVFVASFAHETSSYSPITTSRASFEEFDYYRPEHGRAEPKSRALSGYGCFVTKAQEDGHEVYCSTYTWAQPSGPCNARDYEELRDEILDDLRLNGPFDLVLLFLHGAQMAEKYDDCEGDLLSRAREIVGEKAFIGVLLDLHANVSDTMIDKADLLVACREYPHTDYIPRAEELYDAGIYCLENSIKPFPVIKRLPLIGLFYTTLPKMIAVNEAAIDLQRQEGVVSTSVVHGFLWADVEFRGAAVLGYTETPAQTIEEDLIKIGHLFADAKEESMEMQWPLDKVIVTVEGSTIPEGKPVVIADYCDNPGGGNGGDSTFILQAVLERGLTGYGLAMFWDPVVVQLAMAAGVGATAKFRLGGKTGPRAGDPVDVEATVLSIKKDMVQHGIGYQQPAGDTVALEVAGNYVIVGSIRGQVFSPSVFEELGIATSSCRALVVKSTQHFYEQFEPISSDILYCQTPGGMSAEFLRKLEMKNLRRPIWPLDDFDVKEAIG